MYFYKAPKRTLKQSESWEKKVFSVSAVDMAVVKSHYNQQQ